MTNPVRSYPQQRYDVLVIDPPWSYGGQAAAARTVRYATQLAGHQYEVIGNSNGSEINRNTGAGVENIAASFPAADCANDKAALFLWTTNPKLPFAFDLMRLWGFEYKTTLTWLKVSKVGVPLTGGLGWFFRGATEHVLFGTRGSYAIPANLRQPNYVFAERTGHSAKPQAFYDLVERCTPGQTRLDVFARSERPNWDSWGDEITDLKGNESQ
jgi:N6-adenosine-specific RNA methylase IME4